MDASHSFPHSFALICAGLFDCPLLLQCPLPSHILLPLPPPAVGRRTHVCSDRASSLICPGLLTDLLWPVLISYASRAPMEWPRSDIGYKQNHPHVRTATHHFLYVQPLHVVPIPWLSPHDNKSQFCVNTPIDLCAPYGYTLKLELHPVFFPDRFYLITYCGRLNFMARHN